MAKEKMGGSKCRQRGGRKDQKGVNARRKAGLPAKAGKRKVYTTGKRQVKPIPDGSDRFCMNTMHSSACPVMHSTLKERKEIVEKVEKINFGPLSSDPFAKKRMIAHAYSGVLTADDMAVKSHRKH